MCWFLILLFIPFSSWAEQTLAIITGNTPLGSWDPDSCKTGITGSEEAVIYMADKLVQEGYRVVVYAHLPLGCRYSGPESNPRYVGYDYNYPNKFDIAISWRMPTLGASLKEVARATFLWPHDICAVRLTQEEIDAFDDVLWLSHSQRTQWCSINPGMEKFTNIFGNGINPEQFNPIEERENPYSCIYASSYDRGLSVLLDLWPYVKKKYPRATLDIYYGWRDWAQIPPMVESKMRSQIEMYGPLGVKDHGLVGHEELHRAFERASLWTYPCTLLPIETFCITGIKAQYAGAIPVIIDGAALKETVRFGYRCSTSEQYLTILMQAMGNVENVPLSERKKQRTFIQQKFTWKVIAKKWKELFDSFLGD